MSEIPRGLDLPDAYKVVAAVGNNELKAVVLGAMRPEVPYTASPLYSRTMGLQEPGNPAWPMSESTPFDYCATFAGVGMVAKEDVGPGGTLAYSLTSRGAKLGQPFAGHLLDLSAAHKPPLRGIFGAPQATTPDGRRACETRIQIMRFMHAAEGKRSSVSDVAAAIGAVISSVGRVAERLEVFGVVGYESSGRGKPSVRFAALPDFAAADPCSRTQLTTDVAAALKTFFSSSPGATVSNEDIAKMLIESYGYTQPLSELISEVSGRTTRLADIGRIVARVRQVESDKSARGVVWATAPQLEVISDTLDAVDGLVDPTAAYLEGGSEKLKTILGSPQTVNALLAKAKAASVGRKSAREDVERTNARLGALLDSATEPLTVRELLAGLNEGGGTSDPYTVRRYVKELIADGTVQVVETPAGKKYYRER